MNHNAKIPMTKRFASFNFFFFLMLQSLIIKYIYLCSDINTFYLLNRLILLKQCHTNIVHQKHDCVKFENSFQTIHTHTNTNISFY